MQVQVSIKINRPTETVSQALLTPENAVHWTTDLERFEIVERKPGEVGSVARLHYLQGGKRYTMEDRLLECEPGKRFLSEVTGGGIKARVETVLNPINGGAGTEVQMTWSGTGGSILTKILLPFLKGKIAQQAGIDLKKFKDLIETRGVQFSNDTTGKT